MTAGSDLATRGTIGDDVRGHMRALDGWRGLAILMVVLHNGAYVVVADPNLLAKLIRGTLAAGWAGVSLFFVLSGFLISGILLDTKDSPRFLRHFYVRRTLRIFPLYYATLFVICIVLPLFLSPGEWSASVREHQIWYWTYLPNWVSLRGGGIDGLSHFWSLGVEEQFYLLWPPLILFARNGWFPRIAALIALGAPLSRLWMHSVGLPAEALYEFTNARIDALAIGALLAVTARREDWLAALWRTRGRLLGAVTAALVAVLLWTQGFEAYDPVVLILGQSLIAILFAVLMLVTIRPVTREERLLTRWMSIGWLCSLGKYSYAIYVFHFPLHAIARQHLDPMIELAGPTARVFLGIVYAIGLLGASTLVAIASWHVLEKRFLGLKERLAPRPI